MFNTKEYQTKIKKDIIACLEDMSAQPILFIGSGLSKRYFEAPNWIELLKRLGEKCPDVEHYFGYYNQKHDKETKLRFAYFNC